MRLRLFFVVVVLSFLSSCHGHKNNSAPAQPANLGGGYTLEATGGTLNDGSGASGLAVLATLRDSSGNGPGGAAGWKITITGPGIDVPLVVAYDDGSPSSYSAWWWGNYNPQSGTYTATATNGSVTLTYSFTIDATKNLSQPALNKTGDTISWAPVTGADSYYYELTDGSGDLPVSSGYLEAVPFTSQYSFTIPVLTDGSYLVTVYALTNDRLALSADSASSPSLPVQNNDSIAAIDFVQGGTGSGYTLDARGGVLYEGLYSGISGTPTDYYGLVIWTSILTTSTPTTAPAGDWNVSVSGPGITAPITFTYPRTDSQYLYWDFGTVPAAGTYTVTATPVAGGTSLTQSFTIPSLTAKLSVADGLTAAATSGGGASVSWNPVAGAASYYVNIWAEVGGVYTEVTGAWVNSTSATVANGTLTSGVAYDVYVTASELDMSDVKSVPLTVVPGAQVNMSDTTFSPATITGM